MDGKFDLRCCTIVNKPFRNGQDAREARKSIRCGTGILPVLENGARCEFDRTLALNDLNINSLQ